MHKHECVKCRRTYSDADPEPYLCAPCKKEKQAIAARVDAQFAPRPKAKSMLEEYYALPNAPGTNFKLYRP